VRSVAVVPCPDQEWSPFVSTSCFRTVGVIARIAGELPAFAVPGVGLDLTTLTFILPYAAILAAVGLIETLMTLNLIDEMTETRGWPNRECVA